MLLLLIAIFHKRHADRLVGVYRFYMLVALLVVVNWIDLIHAPSGAYDHQFVLCYGGVWRNRVCLE